MQPITPSGRSTTCLLGFALIAVLAAMPSAGAGLDYEIDVNALLHDTQKQTADPDRLTLVWWLPEEFWGWSLTQEGSLSEEGIEEILAVLRPYVLLGVVDGQIGPLGGTTFVDSAKLRASVFFVDGSGERHAPLGNDAISADAHNLVSMLEPVLANMIGSVGENFLFLFFPAERADGARMADATNEGAFSVVVGETTFDWTTPLGSVLRPKICPVDKAQMSGAWSYCPWHGKKLIDGE